MNNKFEQAFDLFLRKTRPIIPHKNTIKNSVIIYSCGDWGKSKQHIPPMDWKNFLKISGTS